MRFLKTAAPQEPNHSHTLARCMSKMLRDVSFMKVLQLADKFSAVFLFSLIAASLTVDPFQQ